MGKMRKAMILVLVAVMVVSGFMMARRNLELKKEEVEYARLQKEMKKEAAAKAKEEAVKRPCSLFQLRYPL